MTTETTQKRCVSTDSAQAAGSVVIWMNSMTCRKCSDGRYIGYDGRGMSGPCDKCGDKQPEKMTRDEYLAPFKPNAGRELRKTTKGLKP